MKHQSRFYGHKDSYIVIHILSSEYPYNYCATILVCYYSEPYFLNFEYPLMVHTHGHVGEIKIHSSSITQSPMSVHYKKPK